MRTPEDTDKNPDDPEPANEAIIEMEYSSDKLYHPKKLNVRT
jgi:hypothetical protein